MAGGYIPLPAYQVPRNALLDFSGLDSGLDTYRQGIEQAYKGQTNRLIGDALKNKDFAGASSAAFQRGDLDTGIKVADYGQKQDDRIKQKIGQLALTAAMEPDPTKRADMLTRIIALHPDRNSLDPIYSNPEYGLKMILSDAGLTGDYYKLRFASNQDARSAASASEERALFPGKLEDQRLGIETKRRELNAPKVTFQKVGQGEAVYAFDPRDPSNAKRVAGEDPGQFGPYKSAKEKAGAEAEMRKEVTKLASDFQVVRDASRQISAVVAAPPTAAGDISLIYSYMKLLDPTSVVRESEYATAQNATGVPSQVINLYNRVRNGERLNPDQRADFANQAQIVYRTKEQSYRHTVDQFRGIAERTGLDPRNVSPDFLMLPQVGDDAAFDALPAGTRFVGPDGQVRVKP